MLYEITCHSRVRGVVSECLAALTGCYGAVGTVTMWDAWRTEFEEPILVGEPALRIQLTFDPSCTTQEMNKAFVQEFINALVTHSGCSTVVCRAVECDVMVPK